MRRFSLTKSRARAIAVLCCTVAAAAAVAACSDDVFAPTIDCDDVIGVIFIELAPPSSSEFLDYTVDVGDSLQVSASLRRVDASEEVFNPQEGWSCTTTASSSVAGAVAFSTPDSTIVRLLAGGWIRGLQVGTAFVAASSTSPVANTEFSVRVHSP
jgi:hypothetical protein